MKYTFWVGALALCLMASCGGHKASGHEEHGHDHAAENHNHEVEDEHVHGTGKETHGADEIVLTPEKAHAAGVETDTIVPGVFYEVIPASGQILAAQGDEAAVVASAPGVVSFTRQLSEGMPVSEGAPLLTVSGRNVQDGDAVTRAKVAYETARNEYERASKLLDSRIVSQKEFEVLRQNYENAKVAYEALSPSQDGKGVSVKSPISGYVKSCLVKEGDYVTVGQPLLTVSHTRRLQLRAEVSERYYARLGQIVSANFRTPYDDCIYCLDDLKGRLLSYGKSAGDASFYVPVTFEFDNRGSMVPGTFVEVYLLSGRREGVLSVPVSALTEEQGLNFVYIQMDEECYRKQEVKIGATDGSRVEIVSGLKGGERVVTRGAVHVKLASASNAIPAHTHNH